MAVVAPRASATVGRRLDLLGRLVRRPAAVASLAVVALAVAMAILAPVLAPYDPNAIDIVHRLQAPSSAHLLGTDYLGRDMLSRVMFGARTALSIAIPAVTLGLVPGLVIGVAAGYVGGMTDKVAVVVMDAVISFPSVILALVLLTLMGPSIPVLTLLIIVALIPGYGRLARAQTLAAKQNLYVKAERALGASRTRIMTRHLLPNILPPLLVLMAMDIPNAIGIEAGLAFLGIGLQPPTADWGIMLANGFVYVRTSVWGLAGPLLVITVVTCAFTVLGETLRDLTDPRYAVPRRLGRFGRRQAWELPNA